MALAMAAWVMDNAQWQWAPVPASFARAVLETGVLHHIRQVVELGAVHAGRCAERPGRLRETVTPRRARRCCACKSMCTAHRALTRRCRRSVPAAELNTLLIAFGTWPAP